MTQLPHDPSVNDPSVKRPDDASGKRPDDASCKRVDDASGKRRDDRPNPLLGKLFDSLRGECTPAEMREVEALLAADPAARAERDRLSAFLAVAASAHDVPLDASAGERVAARARERARRLADRPVPNRRPVAIRWARILAVSVGLHAAVLLVLGVTSHSTRGSEDVESKGEGYELRADLPSDGSEAADGADDPVLARELIPSTDPYDLLDGTPIGKIFHQLAAMEDDSSEAFVPGRPSAFARYPASVARPMWLRSNDGAKNEVLQRLGVAVVTLDHVKRGLDALAAKQKEDGSFEAAPGHSKIRSTSLVLLAFLSDGHSSRSGAHRSILEKGIAWLRAAKASPEAAPTLDDGSLALLALAEDYMLSNGSLTPAESRTRALEVQMRAKTIAGTKARRLGEIPPAGWSDLALAAASRLGISRPSTASLATMIVPTAGPEMLRGTAILLGGDVRAFEAWNAEVMPAVSARLLTTGFAKVPAGASLGERLEETALALLALQVSYRTY